MVLHLNFYWFSIIKARPHQGYMCKQNAISQWLSCAAPSRWLHLLHVSENQTFLIYLIITKGQMLLVFVCARDESTFLTTFFKAHASFARTNCKMGEQRALEEWVVERSILFICCPKYIEPTYYEWPKSLGKLTHTRASGHEWHFLNTWAKCALAFLAPYKHSLNRLFGKLYGNGILGYLNGIQMLSVHLPFIANGRCIVVCKLCRCVW